MENKNEIPPLETSELLKAYLVRSYYFSEAMAFYENFYRPVKEALPEEVTRHIPETSSTRPLTWVPLVFHCTTVSAFKEIIASGRGTMDSV